ncbi:MAG: hypothetical protein QXS20_05795 [Candidatus Thorarchaeota archaeon]
MSSEMNMKTLVLHLSAIALVIFYLMYMPYTILSPVVDEWGVLHVWLYYFTLVLGILFPLFYAKGDEDTAWYILGLAIILNSVVWLLATPPLTTNPLLSALMTLLLGVFFFITPLVLKKVSQADMVKNILHIIKGLLILAAAGFYANWVLDDFIGTTSYNHIMPQFLFTGGALTVVFGFVLFVYGLFNIFRMKSGGKASEWFGKISELFYVLMVIVFLIGVTMNVSTHLVAAALVAPWLGATYATSIGFFGSLIVLAGSNLVTFLLIVLYVYGMNKIVEKH